MAHLLCTFACCASAAHAALRPWALAARRQPDEASSRPDWRDAPAMARWLVHVNDWGTLATVSRHLSSGGGSGSKSGGQDKRPVPYGGAVSYSDGPVAGWGTGRLLFYLTSMDATAFDLEARPV